MDDVDQRDGKGRFLPGNAGGPGRPKGGTLDFLATARRLAAEQDKDLEGMIVEVLESMFEAAKQGDVAAARIVIERCCGLLEKDGPQVAIQVNGSEQVAIGPPEPSDADLGDYITDLVTVARRQGLLPEGAD